MINSPQILDIALDHFCAFSNTFTDDSPFSDHSDSYFLDFRILLDSALDPHDSIAADDDRILIAEIALDDELHSITLIIHYCYYIDDTPTLRHLTLLADTNYSDIPLPPPTD